MRINVYNEELTNNVEIVEKVVKEGKKNVTFYGLRLYLESPETINAHSTHEDDDTSAITFWFRDRTKALMWITRIALLFGGHALVKDSDTPLRRLPR